MLFILVLYGQRLTESSSFRTVSASLAASGTEADLFVWDNSPQPQGADCGAVCVPWRSIRYVRATRNEGLGLAYNSGAEYARQTGRRWIVLLDQDTEFAVDFVPRLREAVDVHPGFGLYAPVLKLKSGGCFSPTRYRFKRGHPVRLSPGELPLALYSPVNSGMCIRVDRFFEVGGYDSRVWLDFADFQFVERLRKRYPFFYLFDSTGYQDFSNDETDVDKLSARFRIYCECARRCTRESWRDSLGYFYAVSRHAAGLTLKNRHIRFLKIFITDYLL